MSLLLRICLALPLLFAGHVRAQGVIEIPARATTQSGIGVISGWNCRAREIRIQIDDHMPLVAGTGTDRLDTLSLCGHAATGFSLLFNWNLLARGRPHTVKAFADGSPSPFAVTSFSVMHFGSEYLTGKTGQYSLRNFPDLGSSAELRWDEERQGFNIVWTATGEPDFSGTYYGAVRFGVMSTFCSPIPPTGHPYESRNATFVLDFRAEEASTLQVQYADGRSCRMTERDSDRRRTPDGFLRIGFGASEACPEIVGGLNVSVDGERIKGGSHDSCVTSHIVGVTGP